MRWAGSIRTRLSAGAYTLHFQQLGTGSLSGKDRLDWNTRPSAWFSCPSFKRPSGREAAMGRDLCPNDRCWLDLGQRRTQRHDEGFHWNERRRGEPSCVALNEILPAWGAGSARFLRLGQDLISDGRDLLVEDRYQGSNHGCRASGQRVGREGNRRRSDRHAKKHDRPGSCRYGSIMYEDPGSRVCTSRSRPSFGSPRRYHGSGDHPTIKP